MANQLGRRPGRTSSARRLDLQLAIMVLFGGLTVYTCTHWGDVDIDRAREMYVSPWIITSGYTVGWKSTTNQSASWGILRDRGKPFAILVYRWRRSFTLPDASVRPREHTESH
jgi:hypothetical protein